jgi:hypothetical protein
MGNNGIIGLGGVKVNVSGYGMMVPSENKGDKLIYIGWDMVFSLLCWNTCSCIKVISSKVRRYLLRVMSHDFSSEKSAMKVSSRTSEVF